jgi:putative flavoprotein involved in K+ transport
MRRWARPGHWTLEGDASEADGITEGWIRFETTAARGEGHLRLNADGEAWTFLTAAYELKGYEEPKGSTREKGVEHGLSRGRKTWLAARHFRNKGNQEANDPPAPVYPRT